jgi:hypothetical protein
MCGRCAEGQVYGGHHLRVLGDPGEHANQLQGYLAGPLTEVQRFKFVCPACVWLTAMSRFQQGQAQTAQCPFCPERPEETMHHALLACSAFGTERAAMWAAVERWGGRLSALRELSQLSSSSRHCWGTPSGVTVLKLWMVSSSGTWLRKCGGDGRRCRLLLLLLHWVMRLAIRTMWRARRASSAAVLPLCYCAIAATGGTTRAAWCRRCLVCQMVIGSALGVPLRRPRRLPPRLPLPLRLPAAGPGPLHTMMWLAMCVLASTVRSRCYSVMAATGGSPCGASACAGSARPLGTGTA